MGGQGAGTQAIEGRLFNTNQKFMIQKILVDTSAY